MSRSYRKPFASIVGVSSCKPDRTLASRAFRRFAKNYLRLNFTADDSFLVPTRYEAAHNDRYDWSMDGGNRLVRSRSRFRRGDEYWDNRQFEYWVEVQRK
jgi:hypothetical protein